MIDSSDTDLVFQVKKEDDPDALGELISRHSGIYVDMIKRFGGKSLTDIQLTDLMGEKDYNIYKAALDFKPEKSKFSTYLANRTRYLCLSEKTINKKSPHVVDFDSVVPFIEANCKAPDEQSENRELMMKLSRALESLTDQTAKTIFYERYFSTSNHKLKSWKEIGKILGFSGEWCSQVHDKTLPQLKKQLNNAETTF